MVAIISERVIYRLILTTLIQAQLVGRDIVSVETRYLPVYLGIRNSKAFLLP
jgi:hypothetical protein